MADDMFRGLDLLKSSLDAYALRQKVIAENIANVETPGYRSRSVAFEDLLQGELAKDAPLDLQKNSAGHMGSSASGTAVARVMPASDRALDNGVNDVSLDMEMAALAETNLSQKLAARILALRYKGLRAAIRGSGQP